MIKDQGWIAVEPHILSSVYLIISHSHCKVVFCFPGMIERNSIHHPGYHTGTVYLLRFGDQLYQCLSDIQEDN